MLDSVLSPLHNNSFTLYNNPVEFDAVISSCYRLKKKMRRLKVK